MKALQAITRVLGQAALASLLVAAGGAAAQNTYPQKPITVLIPFAAGGALDAVTRPLGEAYGKAYGQSWIIENLGGAGGTIATARAVRQSPDGYQLLMASSGQVSVAPFVYPSLPYDPSTDLVPIVHLVDSTAVLYTSTKSPYRSARDLVAAAKAAPGSIDFAHTGSGSVSHLALELLQHETGARFVAIPYKGAGIAIGDLAGEQVPLLFTYVSTAKPMVDAGRVRPLAVASEQRLASLPDVPTFAELGIKNIIAKLWIGLMAPAGTPQDIVDTLSRQVNAELDKPAMRARLEPQGLEIKGGSARQFQDMIASDTARWRELSQSVNLAVQ
ncbi:tripartite tricarboxylate transporter substrate binding protein [Bordetella sp. BOR01]|uniref:Bug family tripartite tricarboxylate transporter substrate binding protein n=1 Tax=Bordetella sp. BOR01 TaxID=2854779 RepID=UPI001C47DA3D|nr:tripartite tricarboxylate transporter substrate binding protein [Bordetella sp. BOR01]MBV7483940.1 tripartite tricarboxylate transporter substrate binding protein [Bordetella sp. BOR01]